MSDFDQMLDDIIHEKDEFEEAHKLEKKKQNEREERLDRAGAEIRDRALNRR